jgi:hypothetical protein
MPLMTVSMTVITVLHSAEERSRSCRLHADQVPGGVETKLDECFEDAHRQLAAAMVDDVLAASGILLL